MIMADREPTETSPLLGENRDGRHYEGPEAAEAENGGVAADFAANPEPGRSSNEPDWKRSFILALPALAVGILLVAIDSLLVLATYAKIGSELKALDRTSWISTAYFLTTTSFQPLYGKLSDIFGRKECLLFAYTVFGLGCLGCGLARNIVELCIGRAIAGMGGGGVVAVVSILASDVVTLQERGVWHGYLAMIYAVGTTAGAPLGGFLAENIGWRWSFIAQAPLCVVAFVVVYFVLQVPPRPQQHWLAKIEQIDFLGAFTLIVAVAALLVGLDNGSNRGWLEPLTIVPLALFPLLAIIFLLIEFKVAKYPFAPRHIILGQGMLACYLTNFFGLACQMGVYFFLPLFYQAVLEYDSTRSGALLIPATVTATASSLAAGWYMKRSGKYYWITVAGWGILFLSLIPIFLAVPFHSVISGEVGLFLTSLGASASLTSTVVALLANAEVEDSAIALASTYLFRGFGSSIGVGTSSAVLQQLLQAQLTRKLSGDEAARDIIHRVRESIDVIKILPPHTAALVRSSYQWATIGAFSVCAVYAAPAFLAAFWIREKTLKR